MRKASFTILALSVASLWSAGLVVAETSRGLGGGSSGRDCWVTGTECRPAPAPRSAWPAFTRVAATGVTIVVPDDHATIQAAIDAAAPGDTVYVRAGTYFEHLVLNEQLTLRGEDAATTIIDGSGPGYQIGIDITADGFVLQGFTVQNCGEFSYGNEAGVRVVAAQHARIADCRFTSNTTGVLVYVFDYNVIEHCRFDGNYYGIVSECDLTGMGGVQRSAIVGNVFEQNSTGIIFSHDPGASSNLVQGNILRGNHTGIYIIYSFSNEFSYNVFSDNTGYAFYLDICMCGAYDNRIHHNAFLNNYAGGIQAYETADSAPDVNYWYSPDDGELGEGNFWSDYTGVDSDHDGMGDSPYLIPAEYSNDPRPLMHPFVLGDMNLDGAVNAFDIDPFVLALTDPIAYQSQYLQPGELLGDCNFDWFLDAFDIDPFVYRLTHADELATPPDRPPLAPSDPTPADGAEGVTSPCLVWSCSDPDTASWLAYDVYLEADNPMPGTLVSSGQTETNWCSGTLAPETNYYWRIVARDNHGLETAGPVWHFVTAATVWSIGTVASGVQGRVSLVIDSQDTPHVSYGSYYATWTGMTWESQMAVPSGAYGTSCALDSDDRPHLSYSSAGGLWHTYLAGTAWLAEEVDHLPFDASVIALDSADYPHIAYIGPVSSRALKYACWTGAGWEIETVDSCSGYDLALALDKDDEPHIFYSGTKYAYRAGGSWHVETVHSGGGAYRGHSLVLDAAGQPHLSFVDSTAHALKYAEKVGAAWSVETVSAAGPAAYYSCLRLDGSDRPLIACLVREASLRYALTCVAKPGDEWLAEAVDITGSGGSLSLALDSEGRPQISYGHSGDVRYATRGTGRGAR